MALVNKKRIIVGAIAIFVGSLFLLRFISMDFIPEADEGQITVAAELTTGLRVEETSKFEGSNDHV